MNDIKKYDALPYRNAEDLGFGTYVNTKIRELSQSYNTLNIDTDSIQDSPRNPQRKNILRELSEKLSEYYGENVDIVSWFIVLYHGNGVSKRHTYREIAELLHKMNLSHLGVNGRISYYNDSSIRRLLTDLGWESYMHTEHTETGSLRKGLKKSFENKDEASRLVEKVRNTFPEGFLIPKKEMNEFSTQYAERVLYLLYPYILSLDIDLGRRKKAHLLNQLTGENIFTPDSFRDRSKNNN